VQREKEFSFVISFDPAKEITFRSKIRNTNKNIALQSKMRTEYRDKKNNNASRVTRYKRAPSESFRFFA